MPWQKIAPETLSKIVTFDSCNFDYPYTRESKEAGLCEKQIEGSAGLWNILCEQSLAIMADEVGMGKTFQALAVCSLLWRQKPNARILIISPNGTIASHWKNEYETFIKNHYIQNDHTVKNSVTDGPIHTPAFAGNLYEVVDLFSKQSATLVLAKISSFSTLLTGENRMEGGNKAEKARELAQELRESLAEAMGEEQPIDLLIIDEAHYLRNVSGGSQKVAAAEAFLASESKPIASKVLLMTATPSHSHLNDVNNIVGYFNKTLHALTPEEIFKQIAVRRLRILSSKEHKKGLSKFNYRDEEASPATFDGDIEAELFFALYQRELVNVLNKSGEKRSVMYGYLEGFESLQGVRDVVSDDDDKEAQEKAEIKADAKDSELLSALSKEYYQVYKRFPNHPKYKKLAEQIMADNPKGGLDTEAMEGRKHLIFVRRIASLKEMTQRVNLRFDIEQLKAIVNAWGDLQQWTSEQRQARFDNAHSEGGSRKWYTSLVKELEARTQAHAITDDPLDIQFEQDEGADTTLDEDMDAVGSSDDLRHQSSVMELFSVHKGDGVIERTDASNFRLRFNKPESLFSLFFHPPSDYLQNGSYDQRVMVGKEGSSKKPNYPKAAKAKRLENSPNNAPLKKMLKRFRNSDDEVLDTMDVPVQTFWNIAWPSLDDKCRKEITDWELCTIEDFCRYFESGVLYASSALVELYCVFIKAKGEGSAAERYNRFLSALEATLQKSVIFKLFTEAILTFRTMREKIYEESERENGSSWNMFRRPQHHPAWFVDGSTGQGARDRIRKAFNSPFYPNVLTATSVFQEGVNLHFNCAKVHHYGLAGSAGDNEQRVGRVDRLYGKLHRQIESTGEGKLAIYYPYLVQSFDEIQLSDFIVKKSSIEKQMDRCLQEQQSSVIDESNSREHWDQYLAKPDSAKTDSKDPYVPDLVSEEECKYKGKESIEEFLPLGKQVQDSILSALAEWNYNREDITLFPQGKGSSAADLLVIDNRRTYTHAAHEERSQPVFVELHYFEHLKTDTYGLSYIIRFKTPLIDDESPKEYKALTDQIATEFNKHKEDFPLAQLCFNPEECDTPFGVYIKSDLIITPHADNYMESVSAIEIQEAIDQVQECADLVEYAVREASDINHTQYIEKRGSSQVLSLQPQRVNMGALGADRSSEYIKRFTEWTDPRSQKVFATLESAGSFEKPYELNHKSALVDYSDNGVRLTYLAEDFQESEQMVCWEWFEGLGK